MLALAIVIGTGCTPRIGALSLLVMQGEGYVTVLTKTYAWLFVEPCGQPAGVCGTDGTFYGTWDFHAEAPLSTCRDDEWQHCLEGTR